MPWKEICREKGKRKKVKNKKRGKVRDGERSGRDLIEGGRCRDDHDQYNDIKEFGNCE